MNGLRCVIGRYSWSYGRRGRYADPLPAGVVYRQCRRCRCREELWRTGGGVS